MLEYIQGESDLLASQLRLDAFQRMLHAQPEVDFLRSRSGSDIPRQLGDSLNLLDPGVDVGLELVEEGRIGEEGLWLYSIDGDSIARAMTLIVSFRWTRVVPASTDLGDGLADSWVDR